MMKQLLKRVSSLALALVLVVAMAAPASAATVTFYGKKDIDFEPGSGYTATDLFTKFKDVMPGDTITDTITITNKISKSKYINVYLKAVPHNASNGLTYSESYENKDGKDQANIDGQRDETVESMNEFLAQLTLTVTDKSGKIIYQGQPNDPGQLKKAVSLGKINKNRSMNLKVKLEVPIEMDNEFAQRVGEVDWVFYADIVEGDSLIQTGQLNWPIPVLGTLGAALILFGVVSMRKKKKEENA